MNNLRLLFNVLLFVVFVQSNAQESSRAIGNWSGKLDLPTANLEIIFRISLDSIGNLNAKMDVPKQGAKDLPVNKTLVTSDSLILSVAMIMGKFGGKFENDSTVTGTWSQAGMNVSLTLNKSTTVKKLNRPQMPKSPFQYVKEEVEYINPKSGLKLAGTLTLPENGKKCPSVILISGSGAQDRDETIYEHKPFWVIADYLTKNGIAVLRVDDRGVGGSEGNIGDATSEDFAGDVLAGIEFLKRRDEIDQSKIGLIGHSEGGLIAPMVATKSTEVAFIVSLAGPGINGEQILYEQIELSMKAAEIGEDIINQKLKLQKAIVNILLNEKDSVQRLDRLQRTFTGGMYPMMNEDQKKAFNTQVDAVNNPWFRFFLTYDPYPTLTKVKCPVLALNGEKDLQVPADQNLEAIKKALIEGENKNFKIMKLENLNHLFQHCKTGSGSEYREIEETISPEVLEIMKDWIQKNRFQITINKFK